MISQPDKSFKKMKLEFQAEKKINRIGSLIRNDAKNWYVLVRFVFISIEEKKGTVFQEATAGF